jgi:hypothetical protein
VTVRLSYSHQTSENNLNFFHRYTWHSCHFPGPVLVVDCTMQVNRQVPTNTLACKPGVVKRVRIPLPTTLQERR